MSAINIIFNLALHYYYLQFLNKYSQIGIASLVSDTSNSLLGIKLAKLPAFICFLLSEFLPENASLPRCFTCCLADVKWQEFALNKYYYTLSSLSLF